jgi:hypothetical protein
LLDDKPGGVQQLAAWHADCAVIFLGGVLGKVLKNQKAENEKVLNFLGGVLGDLPVRNHQRWFGSGSPFWVPLLLEKRVID